MIPLFFGLRALPQRELQHRRPWLQWNPRRELDLDEAKEHCRFDILSRSRMNQLVREFSRFGYPDMKSVPENIEIAERAGYEIFNIYTLPEKAWIEDYYEILASRAKSLINHADVAVRDLALETITEIETFRCSEGSYGYVFFVLRRTR